MIYQLADGYHVRIWQPGGPVLEYGPHPTWGDSFVVEQRVHEQLRQERERPRRKAAKRSAQPLPGLEGR